VDAFKFLERNWTIAKRTLQLFYAKHQEAWGLDSVSALFARKHSTLEDFKSTSLPLSQGTQMLLDSSQLSPRD
jgi:hypothetical protein